MSVLERTILLACSTATILIMAPAVLALGAWTGVPAPNPSGGGQGVLNALEDRLPFFGGKPHRTLRL
jgi:hypothetical protein